MWADASGHVVQGDTGVSRSSTNSPFVVAGRLLSVSHGVAHRHVNVSRSVMALFVSEVVNGCGHVTAFQHYLGCDQHGRATGHIYLTPVDRAFIKSIYWRERCRSCARRIRLPRERFAKLNRVRRMYLRRSGVADRC